jgi:hypothetical protein
MKKSKISKKEMESPGQIPFNVLDLDVVIRFPRLQDEENENFLDNCRTCSS